MVSSFVALIGRLLIAVSFIAIGSGRLFDPASASPQIVEGALSPQIATGFGVAAIVLGVALALGVWLRAICILLALLALGAILFLYRPLTDPLMQLLALQATGIIGGLLSLFAFGQTRYSYDAMRARRRSELAEKDAEIRTRDAQLQAAQNTGRDAATRDRVVAPVDSPARRPFWRR